jgi:hypothetical protein
MDCFIRLADGWLY